MQSPRLTNVFGLVAQLVELDKRTSHLLPTGEISWDAEHAQRGMVLTLRYINCVLRRHFSHRLPAWPIHIEKFQSLYARYMVKQQWQYTIDNELPEDELLVELSHWLKTLFANVDEKPRIAVSWDVVDMRLYTLVRDHLSRGWDANEALLAKLQEGSQAEWFQRDYFNIWTTPQHTLISPEYFDK